MSTNVSKAILGVTQTCPLVRFPVYEYRYQNLFSCLCESPRATPLPLGLSNLMLKVQCSGHFCPTCFYHLRVCHSCLLQGRKALWRSANLMSVGWVFQPQCIMILYSTLPCPMPLWTAELREHFFVVLDGCCNTNISGTNDVLKQLCATNLFLNGVFCQSLQHTWSILIWGYQGKGVLNTLLGDLVRFPSVQLLSLDPPLHMTSWATMSWTSSMCNTTFHWLPPCC